MESNLYQCVLPTIKMEDLKVIVLTIRPKTIMTSRRHFAIMAAMILVLKVTSNF